jgi:DNA-binding transcriptional regulator PaaX
MRENSIPYKVLKSLGELLEIGLEILVWDYKSLQRRSGIKYMYLPPRPIFYRGLNSLKKNGFVKKKTINGKKIIELTQKGKGELLKFKLKMKTKNLKWDGKYRGVCWDIPEISRADRNFLRNTLKWLGFVEVQKSFWIIPYEIKDELRKLIRFFRKGLEGDIRFLTIEKIENDEDIKKFFNLK